MTAKKRGLHHRLPELTEAEKDLALQARREYTGVICGSGTQTIRNCRKKQICDTGRGAEQGNKQRMEALKTESNDFRRDANQSVEEMAQQLAEIKPHRKSLFASDDDSESKREYIRGLIAPAIDSVALSFPDFRPDEVTVRKGKVNLSDLSEVGAAA